MRLPEYASRGVAAIRPISQSRLNRIRCTRRRRMTTVSRPAMAAVLLATALAAGCATAPARGLHATPPSLGRLPYSDADVDFMSGMIPHHAQAVIMAGWAPAHGARQDVALLCERIVVGQADEIRSMQQWANDRDLPAPDAKSTRMDMEMDGVEHAML